MKCAHRWIRTNYQYESKRSSFTITVYVVGDFNIQLERADDSNVVRFTELLAGARLRPRCPGINANSSSGRSARYRYHPERPSGTNRQKMAIFCTCGSNNYCKTVEDRWVHAARQFVSIEFSFHPYNI